MRFLSFSLLLVAIFAIACKKQGADVKTAPIVSAPAAAPAKHEPYAIKDSSQIIDLGEGLKLYFVEKGNGAKPQANSTIYINYHGYLTDGKVFDSSFDRGQAVDFNLNGLIQGWQRGLAQVPTGSKVVLIVPPALGYGPQGSGTIPPNSTLIFDIDLINTY